MEIVFGDSTGLYHRHGIAVTLICIMHDKSKIT